MTFLRCLTLTLVVLLPPRAMAEPINPADVYVVDGDTIVARGQRIRLVGFDALELGSHARCGLERMLAARCWPLLGRKGPQMQFGLAIAGSFFGSVR